MGLRHIVGINTYYRKIIWENGVFDIKSLFSLKIYQAFSQISSCHIRHIENILWATAGTLASTLPENPAHNTTGFLFRQLPRSLTSHTAQKRTLASLPAHCQNLPTPPYEGAHGPISVPFKIAWWTWGRPKWSACFLFIYHFIFICIRSYSYFTTFIWPTRRLLCWSVKTFHSWKCRF